MNLSQNLLVVNTPILENIPILKYLGPISAHIVTGNNIINEFLGSITDIVGGRSETYQKQISNIYKEAINELKNSAHELGANCIIGLDLNINEISGKGKNMFMITAIGTAIIIDKQNLSNYSNNNSVIDHESYENYRDKKKLINDIKNQKININESFWSIIIQNKIIEALPFLIQKYFEVKTNESLQLESKERFKKLFSIYLNCFDHKSLNNILFEELKSSSNEKLKFITEIIIERQTFSYNHILKLLKSTDLNIKKRGLELSIANKKQYKIDDKKALEEILDIINSNFKERGTITSKKSLLSSKEKNVWNCECGHQNDIGEYCNQCKNDIMGFNKNEIKINEVIPLINEKIEILSEIFLIKKDDIN